MNDGKGSKKGHVLIITYAFPPAALVGVHRTLKYCRYLEEHGWTPVVLTARTEGVAFTDAGLLAQLPPHIDVYRTFDIDPAKWEERLAHWKMRRQSRSAQKRNLAPGILNSSASERPTGVFGGLKKFLKALLKNSPDSHLFWVPFALIRGAWILATRPIDVIYCSTPPHSSHIAAFLLAKAFGKPYVLDFRDPWYVSGSVRTPAGKVDVLLRIETWLKGKIVRGAKQVICVSRGERDELRREFPQVEEARFSSITNGYDPADSAEEYLRGSADRRLVIIHAGTLYPGVAGSFFEALERLQTKDSDLHGKLEVRLLGDIASEYGDSLRRLQDWGIVRIYGSIPHAEALRMIRASDVLLILMGGSTFFPSHIPAKTFEYLQAEKMILAIAGNGELSEIVCRSGLGVVVPPDSVEEIAGKILALCKAREVGPLQVNPNRGYISTFERPKLAGKLAGILNSVKSAAGPGV